MKTRTRIFQYGSLIEEIRAYASLRVIYFLERNQSCAAQRAKKRDSRPLLRRATGYRRRSRVDEKTRPCPPGSNLPFFFLCLIDPPSMRMAVRSSAGLRSRNRPMAAQPEAQPAPGPSHEPGARIREARARGGRNPGPNAGRAARGLELRLCCRLHSNHRTH